MKTKKINIEFEEVKVANITLDLGNLEQYMSNFLALKNHERNTREILSVMGSNRSNLVEVVILIDEDVDEKKEFENCKDYVSQFGKITSSEIETAYILDKDANGIGYALDYKEMYIYE